MAAQALRLVCRGGPPWDHIRLPRRALCCGRPSIARLPAAPWRAPACDGRAWWACDFEQCTDKTGARRSQPACRCFESCEAIQPTVLCTLIARPQRAYLSATQQRQVAVFLLLQVLVHGPGRCSDNDRQRAPQHRESELAGRFSRLLAS